MSSRRDPVERAADSSADLYDIATWEERSSLDGLATAIYWLLSVLAKVIVIGAALHVLGLILFSAGGLATQLDRQPVLPVLTALSVIPAFGLAAYVWYSDATSSEPLSLLVATFVLSVITAMFAVVINTLFGAVLGRLGIQGTILGMVVLYYGVVGPVEETVKLLAVRLFAYNSDSFDAVVDGAVYGAVAGLGFATIENLIYIARSTAGMDLPAGLGVVAAGGGITAVRALAGPGHVIYSAFAGYYLGLAKFNEGNAGPIVIKGLLIAAFVHATYNLTVGPVSTVLGGVLGLPPLLAYLAYVIVYDGFWAAILIRKINRYRRAYRAARATGSPPRSEPTEFE
jgi:RsiW-degrading membrane proteinase PrsW (M82 family)